MDLPRLPPRPLVRHDGRSCWKGRRIMTLNLIHIHGLAPALFVYSLSDILQDPRCRQDSPDQNTTFQSRFMLTTVMP